AVAPEPRDERLGNDLDRAARGLGRVEAPVVADLIGEGLPHRDRPGRDAAHHHALEYRLSADGRVARALLAPLLGHAPMLPAVALRASACTGAAISRCGRARC